MILVLPFINTVTPRGRRGARLARREEGEYPEYLTDEQRREAGCIAGRMPPYLWKSALSSASNDSSRAWGVGLKAFLLDTPARRESCSQRLRPCSAARLSTHPAHPALPAGPADARCARFSAFSRWPRRCRRSASGSAKAGSGERRRNGPRTPTST